jgi:hypothetical protein
MLILSFNMELYDLLEDWLWLNVNKVIVWLSWSHVEIRTEIIGSDIYRVVCVVYKLRKLRNDPFKGKPYWNFGKDIDDLKRL